MRAPSSGVPSNTADARWDGPAVVPGSLATSDAPTSETSTTPAVISYVRGATRSLSSRRRGGPSRR